MHFQGYFSVIALLGSLSNYDGDGDGDGDGDENVT